MASVVSAIKDTIPISQFNRGLAGQIFTDVKKEGPKVVMKNNTPEVVIIPPDEYVKMMEDINDYLLLTKAVERMESLDPETLLSEEEVMQNLGITQEQIDAVGEVDIE